MKKLIGYSLFCIGIGMLIMCFIESAFIQGYGSVIICKATKPEQLKTLYRSIKLHIVMASSKRFFCRTKLSKCRCIISFWSSPSKIRWICSMKFILAIGKKICQRKLLVWYHVGATPFWWMVDCYWTSQFYHKPVRSCFIL